MNRITIFAITLFASINTFAQWTKPAPPAISNISINTNCYLFNKEANAFLIGGNEWGTRASISEKRGSKFYINLYFKDNNWDGNSYYLINDVESGKLNGSKGYMFIDNLDRIYVDGIPGENKNMGFQFVTNEDGTFKISLSNNNETFNPENYPNTYLGVIPEIEDGRVYFCNLDSLVGKYDPAKFQSSWYVVTAKDYKSYTDKIAQYDAAIELGKALEEAKKYDGIDEELMEDATFAYEHTFTSIDELKEMSDSIKKVIKKIKITLANTDNPVEMLSMYGEVEQTFSTKATTGWVMDTNAENKGASNGNASKDIEKTGYHLENWNNEALGNGSVWAKITDIPNGVYRLSMLAFTNDTLTTLAFAGNDTTRVRTELIDIDRPTEVMAIVDNNEITFGLRLVNSNANWIGLDNVNLYYLGTSYEAYKMVADSYINRSKDYVSLTENGSLTNYSKEHLKEYKSVIKSLSEAKTTEDVIKYLNDFKTVIANLENSIIAYETYVELYTNVGMWLTEQIYENESVKFLDRYINGTDDLLGFNGNGNATFILNSLELTWDEMTDEIKYLQKLYDDAYASILKGGDDCTKLIKNPKFIEEGGWLSAVGPKWPVGNTSICPVVEANNMICNVYQELTNLQNGLYEINVQAVFRPGREYNEENAAKADAVIYINSFESKIPCADINSAEEASEAFAEGKYNVKAYGIVSDGTLHIGIRNNSRLVDGCVLWAGNVSLRYFDKTSNAISDAITFILPYAKDVYAESICGIAEKEALNYAITFAHQEDDPYEEFVNLKQSVDDVIAGNKLYKKLEKAVDILDKAIDNNEADEDIKKTLREINFKVSNLLSKHELTNSKATEALAKIYESIVIAKRYGYAEGTEENPVDYTDLILNNNFDPEDGSLDECNINGWNTTAMNGYKENTVSYNRAEYELNQTIYGLKKGTYKLTVHGYYRAGYANEDEMNLKKDSVDSHLATLYVETPTKKYSKPLLLLTEGASDTQECETGCFTTSEGKYVPTSTSSSVIYFNKGYYLNEITFELSELGAVRIGISKKGIIANDYSVIGQWKLWNLGLVHEDVGINDAETISDNTITGVYTIDGMRLSEPRKGINIIRMSDGTVKKIQN